VFRRERDGRAEGDLVACHDETHSGRRLLSRVMRAGRRLDRAPGLDSVRAFARSERDRLPERLLALELAVPPYLVEVSQKLAAWRDVLADQAGDVR
jgi:nicotinate phosphoribosyltransferase